MTARYAQCLYLQEHVLPLSNECLVRNRSIILDKLTCRDSQVLEGVDVDLQLKFAEKLLNLLSISSPSEELDKNQTSNMLDNILTGSIFITASATYFRKQVLEQFSMQIIQQLLAISSLSNHVFNNAATVFPDLTPKVNSASIYSLSAIVALYEKMSTNQSLLKLFHSDVLVKLIPLISFHLNEIVSETGGDLAAAISTNLYTMRLLRDLAKCYEISSKSSAIRLKQFASGIRNFVVSGLTSGDEQARVVIARLIWACTVSEGINAQVAYIAQLVIAYWNISRSIFPKKFLPVEMDKNFPVSLETEDVLSSILAKSCTAPAADFSQVAVGVAAFHGVSDALLAVISSNSLCHQIVPPMNYRRLAELMACLLNISQSDLIQLVEETASASAEGASMNYQLIGIAKAVEFLCFNLTGMQSKVLTTAEGFLSAAAFQAEFERNCSSIFSAVARRISDDQDLQLGNYVSEESAALFSPRIIYFRGDLFRFSSYLLPWPVGYIRSTRELGETFLPIMLRECVKDIELALLLRERSLTVFEGDLKQLNLLATKKHKSSDSSSNKRSSAVPSSRECDALVLDHKRLEDLDNLVAKSAGFLVEVVKSAPNQLSPDLRSSILKCVCSALLDMLTEFGTVKLNVSTDLKFSLFQALDACTKCFIQIFPQPSLIGLVSKLFRMGSASAVHKDELKIRMVCSDGLRLCESLVHPYARPKLSAPESFILPFTETSADVMASKLVTADSHARLHNTLEKFAQEKIGLIEDREQKNVIPVCRSPRPSSVTLLNPSEDEAKMDSSGEGEESEQHSHQREEVKSKESSRKRNYSASTLSSEDPSTSGASLVAASASAGEMQVAAADEVQRLMNTMPACTTANEDVVMVKSSRMHSARERGDDVEMEGPELVADEADSDDEPLWVLS
eukprot:TRINITY_DN4094_c0_g1_i8.p1 TRINITY_DN4094_c0_g1~~TRINITY_DN4094_c0_g1_i8.p1  ORF type:complete len:909 (+),score=244.94 TRINITY_DN4094_c0_g1_i8:95-2821(+)